MCRLCKRDLTEALYPAGLPEGSSAAPALPQHGDPGRAAGVLLHAVPRGHAAVARQAQPAQRARKHLVRRMDVPALGEALHGGCANAADAPHLHVLCWVHHTLLGCGECSGSASAPVRDWGLPHRVEWKGAGQFWPLNCRSVLEQT
jgi:hypothetical protein